MVQAYIQENDLVKKLFTVIAPLYKEVKGGYTKLTLIGNRRGDNAPLVRLSLTKKSVATPAKGKTEETDKVAKKAAKVAAVVPEVVKATKAAPKLVKRTGKRGDK
jgi:large subunit ribosomal protein L17